MSALIARCIESVRWADEIIVVDSGSSDRTSEICRSLGVQFHVTADWPGHGPQKNRALDRATCDWVLSLDSDEWITPALRAEIVRAVAEPHARNGYEMPRRSSFCGRAMHHSGWWPDYVLRLFRRAHGRFTDDVIHERLVVAGTVGRLREPIMHEAIIDPRPDGGENERIFQPHRHRCGFRVVGARGSRRRSCMAHGRSFERTSCAPAFSTAAKDSCSRSRTPKDRIIVT
jgi:glycosyltransferase involved in cell wall biosynthesis